MRINLHSITYILPIPMDLHNTWENDFYFFLPVQCSYRELFKASVNRTIMDQDLKKIRHDFT